MDKALTEVILMYEYISLVIASISIIFINITVTGILLRLMINWLIDNCSKDLLKAMKDKSF